jgi:hypothetical protein
LKSTLTEGVTPNYLLPFVPGFIVGVLTLLLERNYGGSVLNRRLTPRGEVSVGFGVLRVS